MAMGVLIVSFVVFLLMFEGGRGLGQGIWGWGVVKEGSGDLAN